jgi:hypothetical protein
MVFFLQTQSRNFVDKVCIQETIFKGCYNPEDYILRGHLLEKLTFITN